MSKLLRALLISAVATGVAAYVWSRLAPPPRPSLPAPDPAGPYVDADRLTSEQRDLLLGELNGDLAGL